ncbi:Serine/threonine-protein phosphatase 4 regulatory subunit 1 [Hypsizygus marmoreus]|uniref:Serine/threonine-protein phosphatase 4 regulatory subunit 1 n=1 Tax=Hypsizygus marmoreus TaxID=39966 RepID=A0A369JMR9_HYPMA|nr:Serine/threonine-protein phosphatase 4 regulatory subunit 1 [Hypsizygus marmoreus]
MSAPMHDASELACAPSQSPDQAPNQSQSLLTNPSPRQTLRPPGHIALPPPLFAAAAFPLSPDLSPLYHTAPSSPCSPALQYFTPPTSPPQDDPPPALHIAIPQPTIHPTDDPFPIADLAIDLALDDDGLTTLEKIYLFSRSKASFHRVYITHALPEFLDHVAPQEAIEYVLPLLSGLAMDEDEQVKEALAAELVPLIWWFFTHCRISPDDIRTGDSAHPSPSSHTTISVQAFTPILGTLLLSANPLVGGAARYAVVDLLVRLKTADDREDGIIPLPTQIGDDEHQVEWVTGVFEREERDVFRNEILQQVVIGMGRLDVDFEDPQDDMMIDDADHSHWHEVDVNAVVEVVNPSEQGNGEPGVPSPRATHAARLDTSKDSNVINPYFPVMASQYSVSSPASSAGSTPSSSTTSHTSGSSSSSPGYLKDAPSPTLMTSQLGANGSLQDTHPSGSHSRLASIAEASEIQTVPHSPLSESMSVISHIQMELDASFAQSPRMSGPPLPLPLSPTEESLSSWDHSSDMSPDYRPIRVGDMSPHPGYEIHHYPEEEDEEDEQAAVGRLSSMSLMAAVTASGSLGEDIKEAFVREVERVGHDEVYWVRREASFALGALAKVVPEEVVICSLVPLFDTLRRDSIWHVRHSALFALPAILSRLSPGHRRSLALDTIETLSIDESPVVRSGVLEALGEVLYTFYQDDGGPPESLVQLFLGRKDDKRVRDGQQTPKHTLLAKSSSSKETPIEAFYNDPDRPLICAFNYPAVALTLGRDRWPELREVYLDIAANRAFKIRRTLAASLGELAKIIGEEHARRDLVGVWWDAIRCEEEEVRLRAVESVNLFVMVLGEQAGNIIGGLGTVWDEGTFRGWREREGIAKALADLAQSISEEAPSFVAGLLRRALEDNVAAVREAAISNLPRLWSYLSSHSEPLVQLRADLQSLAKSTIYRRRMTFVACQQALVTPTDDGSPTIPLDTDFWMSIADLTDDTVVGVRIGLARLVGFLYDRSLLESEPPVSGILLSLIQRLSRDPSHEVQSYIPDPFRIHLHDNVTHTNERPMPATSDLSRKYATNLSTFSRPPPLRASLPSRSSSSFLPEGME